MYRCCRQLLFRCGGGGFLSQQQQNVLRCSNLFLLRHTSSAENSDVNVVIPPSSAAGSSSSPSDETRASIESVLETVAQPNFRSSQCCDALLLLSAKTNSVSSVSSDPRFVKLLRSLESNAVDQLQTRAIISGLKALESLQGIGEDSLAARNMENALVWRARTSPIRDLTLMLSFVSPRSRRNEKLSKEVIRAIERRWVEFVDAKSIVGVLHYPECFNETFINRIDDRIVETADAMTPSDLAMILAKKGEKKQRSLPLLKALSFHLTRGAKDLNAKEVSDCLFALKELSFKDGELLEALCDSVRVKEVEAHSVIRSILTSLGQIKFLHRGILDEIALWLTSRKDDVTVKDLVTFLLTTATVDYVPANSEALLNTILERVTYSSLKKDQSSQELIWLDVVWSLSVLGKQNSSHLSTVLSSDFYNKLLYSHDHRNVGVILKVLNLNAVAEFLTPGYTGPLISVSEDPLLRDVKVLSNVTKTKLCESVTDAFSNLAAPPICANVNINTMMGFYCDVECVVDVASLKPLPIKEYSCLGKSPAEVKEVPEGAQRVAVMVQSFHDCLINGSTGGLFSLSKRLLEKRGFRVLLVNFSDLKPQLKKIDKIKILENKLKEILSSSSSQQQQQR